jgi:deazaflavin-dependent oxidoreductase (nitroreductase family)
MHRGPYAAGMGIADTFQRGVLKLHQRAYLGTNGLVGHRMLGVPCLLLFTTGRKTGQRRANALVYAKDGSEYVVVASNNGADRAPGWYHNIRASQEIEYQVGRQRTTGKARVIEQGDPDYERLWRLVNDKNRRRYETYQTMTDRPIPLVAVGPAG